MNEKVNCSLCGNESEQVNIASTSEFGSVDLDLRPPEMKRSTRFAWVKRCPYCGFCSVDITKAFEETNAIIESEEYKSLLKNRNFPDLAISFLCQGLIAEKENKIAQAAWLTIYAAWVCDDKAYELSAIKCRLKANYLIKLAIDKGEIFSDQEGNTNLIRVDLLRRARNFGEALVLIEESLYKIEDILYNRALVLHRRLINQSDSGCHTMEEAENVYRVLYDDEIGPDGYYD